MARFFPISSTTSKLASERLAVLSLLLLAFLTPPFLPLTLTLTFLPSCSFSPSSPCLLPVFLVSLSPSSRLLRLRDAIRAVANERAPLRQYDRPLRIIVNPISGHRKGRELFSRVEHLFRKADVALEITFTSYAGHARSIILGGEHDGRQIPRLSPRSYSGLLVIGGDGTVCEVVNAILEREDWEEVVESLAVGTIPAGSECAFAKMISFIDPLSAAWVLLKGHRVGPVDLLRVRQGARTLHCLCGIGWGIAGKLAEESEALREVYGPARYLVSGLRSFLDLRGCEGKLEILVPKEEEEFSEKCTFAGVCKACEAAKWREEEEAAEGQEEDWEEIAGPFVLVGALKSSKKIAPLVHVADGLIDVVAVQVKKGGRGRERGGHGGKGRKEDRMREEGKGGG
eukprot:273844-Hanusia_phi.AAC.1